MDKRLFDFINSYPFIKCVEKDSTILIMYDIYYITFIKSHFTYEIMYKWISQNRKTCLKDILIPILEKYNIEIIRERNINNLLDI